MIVFCIYVHDTVKAPSIYMYISIYLGKATYDERWTLIHHVTFFFTKVDVNIL